MIIIFDNSDCSNDSYNHTNINTNNKSAGFQRDHRREAELRTAGGGVYTYKCVYIYIYMYIYSIYIYIYILCVIYNLMGVSLSWRRLSLPRDSSVATATDRAGGCQGGPISLSLSLYLSLYMYIYIYIHICTVYTYNYIYYYMHMYVCIYIYI